MSVLLKLVVVEYFAIDYQYLDNQIADIVEVVANQVVTVDFGSLAAVQVDFNLPHSLVLLAVVDFHSANLLQ